MSRSVRILREDDVRAALDMASCIDACERAFASYSTGGAELPSVIHLDVPGVTGRDPREGGAPARPAVLRREGRERLLRRRPAGDRRARDRVRREGRIARGVPVGRRVHHGPSDGRGGRASRPRHLAPGARRRRRGDRNRRTGTPADRRARPGATGVHAGAGVGSRPRASTRTCADDLQGRLGEACVRHRRRLRRGRGRGRRRRHHVYRVARTARVRRHARARVPTSPRSAPTVPASTNWTRRSFDAPTCWWSIRVEQCLALGELQHAPAQADRAVELGTICAGAHDGRTGAQQLTVCDLTGLGVQDVAAANVVMARAGDRGDTLAL